MTIPAEAVNAGAAAIDYWLCENDQSIELSSQIRDMFTEGLTAALPALERQIREQVAREIEARIVMEFDEFDVISNITARDYARLARGKEQP
ncbi:hypothetical protein [Timonella senegalensis]|uniref:hypothetical protein n=1 Tax=Timonella senegalensis TaxID=1465825 RepID=UPI00030B2D14|nr:hypothetical protein [Timonella senegalensis]